MIGIERETTLGHDPELRRVTHMVPITAEMVADATAFTEIMAQVGTRLLRSLIDQGDALVRLGAALRGITVDDRYRLAQGRTKRRATRHRHARQGRR